MQVLQLLTFFFELSLYFPIFFFFCRVFVPVSRSHVNITACVKKKQKTNLYNTRGVTPKRVTSALAHLRGQALEQRKSVETSVTAVASRWQHCVPFVRLMIQTQTFRTDS